MAPRKDDSRWGSIKSRYIEIQSENNSVLCNILATVFTWILLAGFLVLPSTFQVLEKIQTDSTIFKEILSDVQHVPLLVVGFSCYTIGGIGLCYLWWRQRAHYQRLVNSLFVPGGFSGLGGLISAFVSIYTHNNGVYSASSIASVAVTGGTAAVCTILAVLYSLLLLRQIKNNYDKKPKEKKAGSEAGTESGTEG